MSSTGIFLYNSLTRRKEELVPRVAGEVGLYVCGVTPYDKLHIGHARAFLTYDVLRRWMEASGLRVRHVQNVTDIDDKIINRAREVGEDPLKLAWRFSDQALQELGQLGIIPAHDYPRVTGHIAPILSMVEKLESKGFAYARGGDVYFDVSKDDDYGKLSGQRVEDLEAGARIAPGELKDDPLDFALWKGAKPDEPSWESPWGPGRPGWHIECSAMALELLGEGFDIHGGARELIFPHHENEIAQSESFLGDHCTFARTWWHCGELRVGGQKMSKSLGNFVSVADALAQADKNVWRLLFLMTHPRSPLDYGEEKLEQARNSWSRLFNALSQLPEESHGPTPASLALGARFAESLGDDLNTPEALSVIFEAVSEWHRGDDVAVAYWAKRALETLGFDLTPVTAGDALTPALLELLIQVRQEARERRDFRTSDLIRERLKTIGVVLEDGIDGARWKIER